MALKVVDPTFTYLICVTVMLVSILCLLIQMIWISDTQSILYANANEFGKNLSKNISYNPHKPNLLLHQISNIYKEFGRRFFDEINMHSNWIELLNKPHINHINICIHILDNQGGLGNRIYRDPALYFLAYTHNCTLSLHWGKCQIYDNYFNNLFEDSFELVASTWPHLRSFGTLFAVPSHPTIQYVPIHTKVLKILPFTDIIVEIHNNSNYNERSIYEDYQFPETDYKWIDTDINRKYAELRPWSGFTVLYPTLRMYGLLVQQLRPIFRVEMAQYVQQKYSNKFVIAIHLRTGIGEKGYNRGPPEVEDIFHQIEFILGTVLSDKDILGGNKFVNNGKIGFFVATDNADVFKDIKNDTKLLGRYSNDTFTRTATEVEWTKDGKPTSTFGKDFQTSNCVNDAKNAYIDSELLGFSDLLLLPFVSTFTKLSRALMMKRKKIICIGRRNRNTWMSHYSCQNFETNKKLTAATHIIH
eukprot:100924_1